MSNNVSILQVDRNKELCRESLMCFLSLPKLNRSRKFATVFKKHCKNENESTINRKMKRRWRICVPFHAKTRANIIIMLLVLGMVVLTKILLKRVKVNTSSYFRDEDAKYPHVPLDAVWQPVAGTKSRFYVYSAFVESHTVSAVRIIAVTKTHAPESVVCRLYMSSNRTLTLKARVQTIREHWDLKYSATFVLCLLSGSGVHPLETVGASISILAATDTRRPSTNILKVLSTEPKHRDKETLHICVKPLRWLHSPSNWLVEWIQINLILGVSHFYMYNVSLSSTAGCILEYYKKQGLITMLPWRLPFVSKVEIRTEGQFAAFNDCLYRSMPNAGWLLLLDVDEVVFPRKQTTLTEMLTELRRSYLLKAPSAFLFRNVFFNLLLDDDPEESVPLMTSRKTRRRAVPLPLKIRSKYVVRPRDAIELGNHFVWQLAPGASSDGVHPDNALLHHYRDACEYPGMSCLTRLSVVDRTARRWSEELWRRVTNDKSCLCNICPLDEKSYETLESYQRKMKHF